MNTWKISEAFADAMTYTLLHSLWQGLLILLILRTLLLFIGERNSGKRYSFTAFSLLALFCSSAVTFLILYRPQDEHVPIFSAYRLSGVQIDKASPVSVFSWISEVISINKAYILTAWGIGAAVYLLKLVGGYWYLRGLKRSCVIVNNEWSARVRELSYKLKIDCRVVLAESARVYSPVVIGFVKPFILLPAGLASGLTTDQLEAIFIHELVHIKRNDYLLNLLQSLMEALFFFNPFVWVLSSRLRTEREHCCDDAVVSNGVSAKAYVFALATIEETRVTSSLAMSLTGNKNQLLQRIKRLMEKSAKNQSLKERAIPVLFLFIGLMCASWFSIQKGDSKKTLSDDKIVASDTVKPKKEKSATYSRKKTTVVAPDGTPHEELVETFEGDEDLRPLMDEFSFETDFVAPPVTDFSFGPDFMIPPVPEFSLPPDLTFPDAFFGMDSIPPGHPFHGDVNAFAQEFTKKFQEQFGDFYQKNQGEFEQMVKEFQEKFEENNVWMEELKAAAHERHGAMEQQAMALAEHENDLRGHEKEIQKFEEHMRDWEKENHEKLKELEANMQELEKKMKSFEKDLKEELVRDGYLKSGDHIRSMHWNDDGEIEINGAQIKDSDVQKYRELHEKYFGKDAHGTFHFSE
jgi:bla regulator protein blaR1